MKVSLPSTRPPVHPPGPSPRTTTISSGPFRRRHSMNMRTYASILNQLSSIIHPVAAAKLLPNASGHKGGNLLGGVGWRGRGFMLKLWFCTSRSRFFLRVCFTCKPMAGSQRGEEVKHPSYPQVLPLYLYWSAFFLCPNLYVYFVLLLD